MPLFKKVACFTDLHLGAKSNSQIHLDDCEEFIDWFIEQAKKNNCETGIFLGDWSHNRNQLNLITLDYSIRCLEKLGAAFEQFFWFPGNHDLFYRDKRNIHSSAFGRHIPGVTVIDKITTTEEVTLVPWLVNDEWKTIPKLKSKYVFGHFELPLFYMNAMVQMPDHGELQSSHFKNQEFVFSGHFHKRQNKSNVWYIGNAFPHNYSDSWDDERGMMILEWGGSPQFINWQHAPKFRTVKLSQLIDQKDSIIKSKMYLKVNIDVNITYEEANLLKETFMTDPDVREISLMQSEENLNGGVEEHHEIKIESVNQIVANQIINIDSNQFDPKVLLSIYQNL
jgi:hypothetical protein